MDQRFAVPGIDAFTPLGDAAPAILMAKAQPLFDLEEAACSGADMDAVHDMRVASRRLREAMRLLSPVFARKEYDAWYRRVRRITRALGPVRDSDVFIDAFSRFGRNLGDGGKRAIAFLVGFRMAQREHELIALNKALTSLDLAENRRSFAKLSRSTRRTAEADRPLSAFAHAAVAERLSTVFGMLPDALDEANIETQHALRIAFKRLRYAVEVFAPCYGDDFDAPHDTLTAFQDSLGDMHDLHVFLDMLRDPARVAAASRAGVSEEDLGEVVTLLEQRAHTKFGQFSALAKKHSASTLMPALLLPLSRIPEPHAQQSAPTEEDAAGPLDTSAAVVETSAESAVPAPAIVASQPAVLVEPPPAVVTIANFNGIAVTPPVVVGAEPWAKPGDRTAAQPAAAGAVSADAEGATVGEQPVGTPADQQPVAIAEVPNTPSAEEPVAVTLPGEDAS